MLFNGNNQSSLSIHFLRPKGVKGGGGWVTRTLGHPIPLRHAPVLVQLVTRLHHCPFGVSTLACLQCMDLHSSAGRAVQHERRGHGKLFFGNCDGNIFNSFVFPQFTSSFSVSFLSRVDELNKLACLHCMGLHSSAGKALQRERRGHGKPFQFGNCDGHIFISFAFPQFTSFHSVFHSFHGLMNSINCPASNVWVFTAQLGEHCSANAEATGLSPVEAPKNVFFFGLLRNCLNCSSTAMVTYSFHLYSRSSHHFILCFEIRL